MESSRAAGEIVLKLPEVVDPIRHIRSTLLITSLAAIRDHGYEKPYLEAIPPKHYATIKEAVAGVWLPIEVGIAHYEACNALQLTSDAQIRMGRHVGTKMQGTLLGTVVRIAKEAGVTPWTIIPQFARFWPRAFDGGGLGAWKMGPKEALIECRDICLVDIPYFRSSLCGVVGIVLDHFCTRAYAHVRMNTLPQVGCTTVRVQWV